MIDGPNIFVEKRSKPLSDLPETRYGSKPTDGGFLIIEPDDYESVMADPIAAQYVRPFVGSKELIHGLPRWCLWLEAASAQDLQDSSVLRARVTAVHDFRLDSKKEQTRALADTPQLFAERRPAASDYVCIPSVVSERRPYITARHLDVKVITSNLAFTAADPDGFLFAIISSLMFMTWQRMVGGRLESRLRFSNTVVWNNFPMPSIGEDRRREIVAAGQGVLTARANAGAHSLSDLYSEAGIPAELQSAHDVLDMVIDAAFDLDSDVSESMRREALFSQYSRIRSNY